MTAYYVPLELTRAQKLELLSSNMPTRVVAAKLGVNLTHAAELRRRAGWPHEPRCRRAALMLQGRSFAPAVPDSRASIPCPECGSMVAAYRMVTHAGSATCAKAKAKSASGSNQPKARPSFSKNEIAARREQVIALFMAGSTTAQIMAEVGIAKSAVNRILKDVR